MENQFKVENGFWVNSLHPSTKLKTIAILYDELEESDVLIKWGEPKKVYDYKAQMELDHLNAQTLLVKYRVLEVPAEEAYEDLLNKAMNVSASKKITELAQFIDDFQNRLKGNDLSIIKLNDMAEFFHRVTQIVADAKRYNAVYINEIDDWDDKPGISTNLAIIHSEVSRSLNALRRGDREEFEVGLSATITRALTLAHSLGVDIESVVKQKTKEALENPKEY